VARRQQRRRPAYRPPRGAAPDNTRELAALDAGARRLVAVHDARALESLVQDLRQLRDEADRVASDQPSPDALRAYRRATRELTEAERAIVLINGEA
jgi:hypothetical protein